MFSWDRPPFPWGGNTPRFPLSQERGRQNAFSSQMQHVLNSCFSRFLSSCLSQGLGVVIVWVAKLVPPSWLCRQVTDPALGVPGLHMCGSCHLLFSAVGFSGPFRAIRKSWLGAVYHWDTGLGPQGPFIKEWGSHPGLLSPDVLLCLHTPHLSGPQLRSSPTAVAQGQLEQGG